MCQLLAWGKCGVKLSPRANSCDESAPGTSDESTVVGYQHGRKHPVRGEGDAAIEGVTYRAGTLVCVNVVMHILWVNLR